MALTVDSAPVEANHFEAMRHAMVASQLRTNAVSDVRVVEAMARVPARTSFPKSIARSPIATRCCRSPAGAGTTCRSPRAGCSPSRRFVLPTRCC